MSTNSFAGIVALRQGDPPEGRAKYPLGQGYGGGDGFTFVTGDEVFSFNTNQIQGPQKPSGIYGLWVDATALTSGKTVTVQIGSQKFVFVGGSTGQGYIPVNATVPATVTISSETGAAGTVYVELYNFNPLFTGVNGGVPAGSSGGVGSFRGGPGKQIRG